MNSQLLEVLLENNLQYNATYQGGLSNHNSMALIALSKLGADDHRLQAFYNKQIQELEPIPVGKQTILLSDWLNYLGQHEYISEYFHFFKAWMKEQGTHAVMKIALKSLMKGCGGDAFHPLIQLAYAVMQVNQDQIAFALAYLADAYLDLGEIPHSQGKLTPLECLTSINKSTLGRDNSDLHGLIWKRMQVISTLDGFYELQKSVRVDEHFLKELADAILRAYISTRDFTILHGVTSTHAMRYILPCIEDKPTALRYFWQAILAAALSIEQEHLINEEKVKACDKQPFVSWDIIKERATLSDDVHVIKLAYSCHDEMSFYQQPLYQKLAALIVKKTNS